MLRAICLSTTTGALALKSATPTVFAETVFTKRIFFTSPTPACQLRGACPLCAARGRGSRQQRVRGGRPGAAGSQFLVSVAVRPAPRGPAAGSLKAGSKRVLKCGLPPPHPVILGVVQLRDIESIHLATLNQYVPAKAVTPVCDSSSSSSMSSSSSGIPWYTELPRPPISSSADGGGGHRWWRR